MENEKDKDLQNPQLPDDSSSDEDNRDPAWKYISKPMEWLFTVDVIPDVKTNCIMIHCILISL